MVEHLIPILQSLRFESSRIFTQKYFFLLRFKRRRMEWGLNPHRGPPKFLLLLSNQSRLRIFSGLRFESLWSITQPCFFLNDQGWIRQLVEYLTVKSVDLRFESSWRSTRNFYFTRLTCNFLQMSTLNFFFLARLVEHLILILQSLRFESSRELTLKYEVWIFTKVHPNLFFCPAGRADGEVLRSKV